MNENESSQLANQNSSANQQAKQSSKSLWITGAIIIFLVSALVTNGFGIFKGNGNSIHEEILAVEHSPVLGSPEAPVIIYEFSDFSCPFCQDAEPAVEQVIEEYVKTGKARIVFKYFPTHATAQPAHAAAYAMEEQSLFWEFQSRAFRAGQDQEDLEKMKELAVELGADKVKLEAFLNSGKASVYTQKDIAMGKAVGVTGTPTFIINSKVLVGAQPYSEFKKVIDKEL